MDEELNNWIKQCPGDSVVVEDPNGDYGFVDWYETQEKGFDRRTIVYDPQKVT